MVNCPACGSENCQKLSVIYKLGTSEMKTTYKLSVERNPFVKDNIDMGGTSQSSTAAAQEAAPPNEATPIAVLFAAFFFLVLTLIAFGTLSGWLHILTAFLGYLSVMNFFVAFPKQLKDRASYSERYQKWLDSWHCNKCGGKFHQVL